MNAPLVLSLFPGIGLLDMAFEEAGFCVVRGPDLLWGGDVRRFHPPAGRFDGVIGGPPCQRYSLLSALVRARYGEAAVAECRIPDFERVILEADPSWFLMENVEAAPAPIVPGFAVTAQMIADHWVGGHTRRLRRFSFGSASPRRFHVETLALHRPDPDNAVCGTAGGAKSTPSMSSKLEGQGLPPSFFDGLPFTLDAKRQMVGNGVPLAMGRAVAAAVCRAIGFEPQPVLIPEAAE